MRHGGSATTQTVAKTTFVLRDADLLKLSKAFAEFGSEISFGVGCADSINRDFSLKELREYENAFARRILSLRIIARDKEITRSAILRLRESSLLWSGTDLDISGPEQMVTKLQGRLQEIMEGMKPWYAFIARFDFASWLWGALFAFWLGVVIVIAIADPKKARPDITIIDAARGQLIGIAIIALIVVTGKLLTRMRDGLFPQVVFAIGQGLQRHEQKEFWRRTVVVGIVIGFLVSVAASLLVAFVA